MIRQYICIALCIFFCFINILHAEIKTTYTTLNTFSSHDQITIESDFIVAIELNHRQNWYSYWKNPGDTGLKPDLKWKQISGFNPQEMVYPAPQRYQSEGLINFGLKNPATLLIPFKLDSSIKKGEHTLQAELKWLVCEKICVPESAFLEFKVTVADTPKLSTKKAFIESLLNNRQWEQLSTTFKTTKTNIIINISTLTPNATIKYFYPHNPLFDI